MNCCELYPIKPIKMCMYVVINILVLFHPIKAKWGQQNTFISLNYQLCLLGKTFHGGISRTNNSYQYKNKQSNFKVS